MAKQGVGKTALGAAVCRLIEQSQPQETRLFHDPVVKDLVGTTIRVLMQFESLRTFTRKQTDAITPGIYGAQICRTRILDDAVQAALSQGRCSPKRFISQRNRRARAICAPSSKLPSFA